MAEDGFRKYEPFFGKWKAGKELGKGAFGHVYEIYRDDVTGKRLFSALKVMHIPKEDALRTQMEIQPDTRAVRAYFSAQIERMREEIRILKKCRGHSNIVSYEEHMIVEDAGNHAVGWDILIRMERLYPVTPRTFAQINATQYDVLRMWRDIANALIFCEDQNIIHRDIKPANILLSGTGNYKLTDFGVARELAERGQEASTRVGTEPYMAPEVYDKRNQKYDGRADLYSLGRVIYYYLNQNRHAFLPPYPQEITAEDTERAELMRLGGEKIPKIDGVSKEINDLLLKSLSFRPSNRPKSARELYCEIGNILEKQSRELKRKPLRAQSTAEFVDATTDTQNRQSRSEREEMHRQKTDAGFRSESEWMHRWKAAAVICLLVGMALIGYSRIIENNRGGNVSGNDSEVAAGRTTETQQIPETEVLIFTEPPGESMEESCGKLPDESEPAVMLLGKLESPQDGEAASSNLKVKGWALVNETAGDLSGRVDFSLNGEIVKSEAVELSELSEKLFLKRQRDYQSDIAAVGGYEIKKTLDVADLEPGTYELSLCIESRAAGVKDSEVRIGSALVTLTGPERLAETEPVEELGIHYRKEEYAIGLDLEDLTHGIMANNGQILVSGWINAPEETSLSMVYVIDSVSYIRSTIEEAGGSVRIIRAKRNLEQMDSAMIGEVVMDMEKSGFLILLRLPFLEDGTHTLQLSPNVGLKETGEDAPYDFAPFPLSIDSTIALSEVTDEETGLTAAADAIISGWAAEFPEEEETTESIQEIWME